VRKGESIIREDEGRVAGQRKKKKGRERRGRERGYMRREERRERERGGVRRREKMERKGIDGEEEGGRGWRGREREERR